MATNHRHWSGSWIFAVAALPAFLAPPVSAQQPSPTATRYQADVQERFQGSCVTVAGGTSSAFADAIARENPRWKEVATKGNIQLD